MKAKAAIFWEVGKKLDIQEVDVEKPHTGEVLVKLAAAGICHSGRWRCRWGTVWPDSALVLITTR